MTDLLEKKPKRKTGTPPAKKWRNVWRATEPLCRPWGERVPGGDTFRGALVFPSQDVAETFAADAMRDQLQSYGYLIAEYLGAEPEE